MLPRSTPHVQPTRDDLRTAALDYCRRGWSILPIRRGGKTPLVPWRRYQTERPSPRAVERWLSREDIRGVAIICGAVSGGLAARDYAQADAYHAWAAAHPDLAATLPTVRTARGYHVYCRLAAERYDTLPDGELRGTSGHYVLAPPSVHPTVPSTPGSPRSPTRPSPSSTPSPPDSSRHPTV